MYLFGKITVKPQLPERISKLNDISNNIWWTWNVNCLKLFEEIDLELWKKVSKNPITFLKQANQERLNEVAKNEGFLKNYDTIVKQFDDYINSSNSWFAKTYPQHKDKLVAYFSAEYGLDETIPIYSGGLGILSGDHCKAASDLGLPFVGIGLLYKQGYSNQYVNQDGMQTYAPVDINIDELPILPVLDKNGEQMSFDLEFPDRKVFVKIWQIKVGKISVYLLDTDFDKNNEIDRKLTHRLYGGDQEMRISQEIILGIGGIKALKLLELSPTIYHMNEGHSAFAGLELTKNLMHEQHVSYNVAKEIVFSRLIFTTHTPVPAGNDIFPFELMEKYFSNYWGYLGLNKKDFMDLALKPAPSYNQGFNMGVLAFRFAGMRNGVSKLHESVTKDLFGDIWPGLSHAELPITHITNGIHTCTWVQPTVKELFNKYFEPFWQEKIEQPNVWEAVHNIPDEELWNVHNIQKNKLISIIKENVREQMLRNHHSLDEIKELEKNINPNAFIVGFARRFATYKRADLIFKDPERLLSILNNPEKPVILVFSGKAHPKDVQGQELIKHIIELSYKPQFIGKIIFIENYNMKISRYLVSGSDIWLNNPRRPLEASGTSGQKAAVNGVINFSILDGWWFEGYNAKNGWAIGSTSSYPSFEEQDLADSQSIYDILENEIVPLYYDRNENNYSHGWLEKMRHSIKSCGCEYSTQRMVIDYTNKLYIPQIERTTSNNFADSEKVLEFNNWKKYMAENWDSLNIYQSSNLDNIHVDAGNNINVSCIVESPIIHISSLDVEVYFAKVNEHGTLEDIQITTMNIEEIEQNKFMCTAQLKLDNGGEYGYTYRIVPKHDMLISKYELGLLKWINS